MNFNLCLGFVVMCYMYLLMWFDFIGWGLVIILCFVVMVKLVLECVYFEMYRKKRYNVEYFFGIKSFVIMRFICLIWFWCFIVLLV